MKFDMRSCPVVFCLFASGFAALEVDVEDFGAVADNKTLASDAINKALLHVSAKGGGVVHARAKAGVYRVARIEMQSHTELRIASGTTLYASDNKKDWTPRTLAAPEACGGDYVETSTRGGVFSALRQKNFSITGGGHINGGGAVWNNDPKRSHFLLFTDVSDVVVEDLLITNSSQWTLRPMFSQRLTFRRLRILGDPTGPNHHNTDGFDPWGCKDASFTDSYYEAGDDCVAVKSGKNGAPIPQQTGECGVPSENIYVNNVTCKATHGLTIGSEISGGIRNITFTNVHVDAGMAVKIKGACGRGAYVRDILYENITGGSGIDTAVWIDMKYGKGPSDCNASGTPAFDNIRVKNVHVKEAQTAFAFVGLKIDGEKHKVPIQGVSLENIVVKKYKSRGSCSQANLTVIGDVSPAIPSDNPTCTIAGQAPTFISV